MNIFSKFFKKSTCECNSIVSLANLVKDPDKDFFNKHKQDVKELEKTYGEIIKQNKSNLMKELEKMNRVINKLIPNSPTETLLVLDASTGQNGIKQAISFKEITNITGIVLTKMDGTAKGGIVLAIKEEVGVPVKFIGFGERAEDLQEFDIEQYIYGLFKDFMEEK